MYRLVVHRRAVRYLKRLPQPNQTRIKNILRKLRDSPFGLPDLKQMVGEWAGQGPSRELPNHILG